VDAESGRMVEVRRERGVWWRMFTCLP
jgi:hypothetical protein